MHTVTSFGISLPQKLAEEIEKRRITQNGIISRSQVVLILIEKALEMEKRQKKA